MISIELMNMSGKVIEVKIDYKNNEVLVGYGEGLPSRIWGGSKFERTESCDLIIPLNYFLEKYPEYGIPNNKLSRQVYKNMIPSECGKYLIKENT